MNLEMHNVFFSNDDYVSNCLYMSEINRDHLALRKHKCKEMPVELLSRTKGCCASSVAGMGQDYGRAMDRTTGLSGKPASPMQRNVRPTRSHEWRNAGLSFTDGDTLASLAKLQPRFSGCAAACASEPDFPKLR